MCECVNGFTLCIILISPPHQSVNVAEVAAPWQAEGVWHFREKLLFSLYKIIGLPNSRETIFGVHEIHIMNGNVKTYWNFKFKTKVAFLKEEKITWWRKYTKVSWLFNLIQGRMFWLLKVKLCYCAVQCSGNCVHQTRVWLAWIYHLQRAPVPA